MTAEPSGPSSESAAAPGPPAEAAAASSSVTPITPGAARRLPLWLLTVGVGLMAGVVSWAGGELIYSAFRVEDAAVYPANYKSLGGYRKEAADSRIRSEAEHVVERKKAAASFGWLGLVLAAGLGLIGGRVAGSSRAAVAGIIAGGLAGVAAGAGTSWVAVPLFFRFQTPESGLGVLSLTHGVIFAGVGVAAGLALGLGLGDRPAMGRATFGGLLGGLIGTIALEVVDSLAFPLMRTFEPIASEGLPRGVMYSCAAVGAALASGMAVGSRPRRPGPVPAATRPATPAGDS